MAASKCKQCNRDIDKGLTRCPGCGTAVHQQTTLCTWVVVMGGLAALVTVTRPELTPEQRAERDSRRAELAAMNAEFRASRQTQVESDPGNAPSGEVQELVWIEKGKDAIRNRMKDPGSSVFQNVFFSRTSDGAPVTCGEVNGKNSFGGYSGFQRFVSAGSPELSFLETEVADFSTLWDTMCAQ